MKKVKFTEVFEDVTKQGVKIPTNLYLEKGLYPIVDQGQSEIAGYINEKDGIFEDVPVIIFGDHTRIIKFIDKPFFLGADGVKVLKSIIKEVDYKYLYYVLFNAKIPDTGYNRHFKWLKETEIPLPSLEEQKKIAERLDKVSSLIEKRKTQLTKLDQLIKSRFIEMFENKGYPQITIVELVASKVSSVKKVFLPTDVIKYIDISSIDNKRNVMTGYTEYILGEAPSRAQQYIKKGDIVVSTVRPNLKNVAITNFESNNLVASSGFCVLRAEKCLPSYLMAVVCSDDFTDAMTKVVTGANYPAIKDSDVRNYVVPNPPIELQEQFSAFVEQTDKSKLTIQKSIDKLETLKKSLMQQYFG